MLFNSYEFIFLFLPLALLIFYQIGNRGYYKIAAAFLISASLIFYGWSNPAFVLLLSLSIVFNYGLGSILRREGLQFSHRRLALFLGVSVNLFLIGYYKYIGFLISTVNGLLNTQLPSINPGLPLGISFFSFVQIAYLVDTYRGQTKEHNFLTYCLFACFFPQVTSGPIVRHKDTIPQFLNRALGRFNYEDMAVGLTLFSIGLFKKVMFADRIAAYATPVFQAATQGQSISFVAGWVGALAYTLQLYFDFSAYSDMAIGIGRMFGIKLPLNFDSPYKAVSVVDFWRRWHITLSHFLRDYLYIPLGGNRKGTVRRYANLMITMLLGGLWHGAGWNFIFWGGLHGVYLVINHMWNAFSKARGYDRQQATWWATGLNTLLTFLAVLVAWIFFRAPNVTVAFAILRGMVGLNGISLPSFLAAKLGFLSSLGIQFTGIAPLKNGDWMNALLAITALLVIVWFTPNTYQWLEHYEPALGYAKNQPSENSVDRFWQRFRWHPTPKSVWIPVLMAAVSILFLSQKTEFIYFQF